MNWEFVPWWRCSMNLKNYKIWATLNTTIVFSPYSRTWPFNIFSNTVTGNWSISKLRNTFTDNTFDFSQGTSIKYWLIRSKYRCLYKKSNDVEENIKGCAEAMHHRSKSLDSHIRHQKNHGRAGGPGLLFSVSGRVRRDPAEWPHQRMFFSRATKQVKFKNLHVLVKMMFRGRNISYSCITVQL